jgi:hypothetical protein
VAEPERLSRPVALVGAAWLLVAILLGAVGAARLQPPPADAQPAGKTHRIGWLAPAANPDNLGAFRAGLRALGYRP